MAREVCECLQFANNPPAQGPGEGREGITEVYWRLGDLFAKYYTALRSEAQGLGGFPLNKALRKDKGLKKDRNPLKKALEKG